MGQGHQEKNNGAVAANIATEGASSTHTSDELCSKRISFNDSDSSSHLSSSLPVKKRFKAGDYDVGVPIKEQPSAVSTGPGVTASPGINDVLLGKGSICFDHIGNRRFRVLVELNVDNYFDSDITASKVEDTSSRTSKQDDIIDSVLSSIQGNCPSGRFLLPVGKSEDSSNDNEVIEEDFDKMFWKSASNKEVRQKVHVTFLAAGRFFIKKDHISEIIKRASQVDDHGGDGVQSVDESNVDTMEQKASKINAGYRSVQTKDERASQVDAKTADKPTTPFTLNMNQPTSFSRILHTGISQQLSLANGLVNNYQSNYIPAMVSTFQSIPIEEFFMPDERDNASTAEAIIPHPAAFIMPSNYDVLCGSGQAFFHHIGNRRFRIMVEMNIERYEKEYLKVGRGENCEIHEIIAQINQSIAARCDPPGRFLAMDMNTGWWRVLSPMYSQLKVEQTLFQCMQVKQRAEKQRIVDLAIEAARQNDQITAAMKEASSFFENKVEAGSYSGYKPKRKRQESASLPKKGLPKGQDKSSIFFPSVFGDKDELMKAQEYAKSSLQRKSTTSKSSNNSESGCDPHQADDNSGVLDAVSGMITLSRRGSSS